VNGHANCCLNHDRRVVANILLWGKAGKITKGFSAKAGTTETDGMETHLQGLPFQ